MSPRNNASPLPCLGVALAAAGCALGQIVWAASTPMADRNQTVAAGIGAADARLSGTDADHAVVAREPEPSI